MTELAIITIGMMIFVYTIDSLFHIGIFDKLEKMLDK